MDLNCYVKRIAWRALGMAMGIQVAAAATVSTLQINTGSQTVSNELNVAGTGTGSFFFIGNGGNNGGTANANGTLVIEPGGALSVSGTFQDNGVIGRDGGCGTVIQNGGLFKFGVTGRGLYIGASSAPQTIAQYWLHGGVLDLDNKSDLVLAYAGNGAFTSALIQAGGVVTNLNKLHIGNGGTKKADVTITGGDMVLGAGGIQGNTNGRLFLGGGTLAASANWTSSFPITLTGENGPATLDTRGYTVTLSGLLSGPGTLSKIGAGTLKLSTGPAHTAALSAQAGTLHVTVAAANARVTTGPFTLADDAALDFEFQRLVPSATVAPLQVQGDLTLGSAPAIMLRNGIWQSTGPFPLITYTGTFSGTLPAAPAATPAGVALTFTHDTAAKCISVTAAPSVVTWDGTDNDWGSQHWLPGNVPGPYSALATVFITHGTVYLEASDLFGPAGITWTTPVSPAIFLNNATLDSKSNYNTLWNLQMGGATLRCNGGANASAQAFQLAGTLTVTNLYGGNAPSRIIVAASPLDNLNNVNIGGNGNPALTLQIDDVTGDTDTDLEIRANLQNWNGTGGRTLVKAGPGTVLLAGTNTFTGGVTLNEGAVAVSSDTALGTGPFTFASNATLVAAANVTLANGGAVSNTATATVTVPEGLTLSLSGAVAGGGTVNKTGAGTLLGRSGGSMANPLTVAAGTVGVAVANTALPYTVASLAFTAPAAGFAVDFGALLPPDNGTAPMQVAGAVDFSAAPSVTLRAPNLGSLAAGAKITLLSWGSAVGTPPSSLTIDSLRPTTGYLVTEGNALKAVLTSRAGISPLRWAGAQSSLWNTTDANWRDASGTAMPFAQTAEYGDDVRMDDTYVTSDATLTLPQTLAPSRVWAENATYAYTLDGPGTLATGTFEKRGTNCLTLNAPVTAKSLSFNGGTAILNSELALGGTGTDSVFYVGNGNTFNGTLVINTGAVLTVNGTFGDNVVIGRNGGTGTVIQNGGLFQAGRIVYVGASNSSNTRALYTLADGTLNIGGNLFIGYGSAVLITGALHQTGGVLTNANPIQIGRGRGVGIYTLTGGTLAVMSGGLTTDSGLYKIELGGGTVLATAPWASSLDMTLTGLDTPVTFATGTHNVSLSGILSGPGGLIKTGTGALTLLGANTYAGATRAAQGTLSVTGSLASCAITVDAGATFGGAGTLAWHTGQTLTVRGTAALGGFALSLAQRPPVGEHLIVDYRDSGALAGGAVFASVTPLPPGAEIVHDPAAKTITLKMRHLGTQLIIR